MISFLRKIMSPSEETVDSKSIDDIRERMANHLKDTKTPALKYPDGFASDRKTVIILDDSAGATMLFDDTIRELQKSGENCVNEIQFVKISTPQAVFMLKNEVNRGNLSNIVGAVLDITIGGYAIVDGNTVILDGIDAFEFLSSRFPEAEMRFFTSHSMNEKNAEIFRFMQKYKKLTGEDITGKTYIKNPFSTNRIDMMRDILESICNAKN